MAAICTVFVYFFILLFDLRVRYVSSIMCAIVTLSLKAAYLLTYLSMAYSFRNMFYQKLFESENYC